MRSADPGEEHAQVVVDFGNGADGGAGILSGGLLRDGNGRGQTGDLVDVGFFHLAQELARIGRQRGDIAALAFGVEGVEGQGAFARTGDAGKAN